MICLGAGNLKFEEAPDYEALRDRFATLYRGLDNDVGILFDWDQLVA